MKPIIDLAVATLGPVLYVLLLGGAVLGLVIGIVLLVNSERVLRWNSTLNRWYNTREAFSRLDQPIDVKRVIYRWHRVAGVLVFAGALFTLDVLAFSYKTGALVRAFGNAGDPNLLYIAFETLRIVLIVGNVAGLVAGGILCFRPSLLKGFEAVGDRYYGGGGGAAKALEIMHFQPDEFVRTHPRLVGALFAGGSAYILIALGLVIL
jgi:hypothetical protein